MYAFNAISIMLFGQRYTITFLSLSLSCHDTQTNKEKNFLRIFFSRSLSRRVVQNFSHVEVIYCFFSHVFSNTEVNKKKKSNQIYHSLCQALSVFALHALVATQFSLSEDYRSIDGGGGKEVSYDIYNTYSIEKKST